VQAGDKVYEMNHITQPFINLTTANAELITRFAQSPEVVELANSGAQKYFELAQKSFGRVAASDAYANLVRQLSENYSNFAHEYSESLMGFAAAGQNLMAQHLEATSSRLEETGKAAAAVIEKASNRPNKPRSKR
jgi:hypothetical protein